MKMTKINLIIFVASIFFVNVFCEEEYYDVSKLKNIDVDEVLQNARLVNNYFKCLMEGRPCTPEGEELKRIVPDAIKTGCIKCSTDQKDVAKKVAIKMEKEYPELWNKLLDKYDPGAVYRHKFAEELRKAGFDI